MQQIIRIFSIAIVAIFLYPHAVEAQAPAVRAQAQAGSPTFEDLQSPQIQTQTRDKRFTPRDWLEIEAAITLKVLPAPPSGMVDRLTVKWYIAVQNPDKRGEFLLLTREVNHVNVPLDEEIFSSVYLSPSSVRRISGDYRNPKKSVQFVGYEVIFNGEIVGTAASRGARDNWWTVASDKVSASDMPLMTKPETPFAALWWDRYAEVAVER